MEVLSGREHAMAVYTGTSGNDTFVGTNSDDLFKLGSGGVDNAQGLDGNDVFDMRHAYTNDDYLDGGADFDTVNLKGDYTSFNVGFDQVHNLEEVIVAPGHSYHFDVVQSAVDSGGMFTIDGRSLRSDDVLFIHNTFITETSLTIYGGHGNDFIAGGAGGDKLYGGLGQDHLVGDDGQSVAVSNDHFIFKSIADSTNASPDLVSWDPTFGDRIDLRHIDADTTQGGNQAFHFIGTSAFSDTPGELRYQSDSFGFAVTGDVDGNGVADFTIETESNLHALPGVLTQADFLL